MKYKSLLKLFKFSSLLFNYLLNHFKYRLKKKLNKFRKWKKRVLTSYRYKLPKKTFKQRFNAVKRAVEKKSVPTNLKTKKWIS